MLLLNTTLIGDSLAVCHSPTDVENMTYTELDAGTYDYLYITNYVDMVLSDYVVPADWDSQTILFAKFNGTTNAGNVYFTLDDIDRVLIKRRAKDYKGNYGDWFTIYSKYPIKKISDLDITYNDQLASSRTEYEYGLFPVKGDIQKIPYRVEVYSQFEGISVVGIDENNSESTNSSFTDEYGNLMLTSWHTPITDGEVNTVRNISKAYNVLLNNKYPVSVSSTIANYTTGTVTGSWFPFDANSCSFIADGRYATGYIEEFIDFLTNGLPKLIKSADGRTWLAEVDASPSNSANGAYNNRQITFSFTETGDYTSENDMYYSHLSNIPERWWNT